MTLLMTTAMHAATLADANPFAAKPVHVPTWIPAVPVVAFVVGRSAWNALKRKVVADHLRSNRTTAAAAPGSSTAATPTAPTLPAPSPSAANLPTLAGDR